jgi:hypothetical protein
MQPPLDPVELPLSVRIMPSRSFLRVGLAAGVALMLLSGWLADAPGGGLMLVWFALGLGTLAALASGLRLLLQLPVIEASELGIAVWLYGPYRSPFFAPWSRVRAVALTQVSRPDAGARAAARDALGIELNRDGSTDLPRLVPDGERPINGAARADLAWSNRSINGDLRRWVALLQAMKKAYENSSTRC